MNQLCRGRGTEKRRKIHLFSISLNYWQGQTTKNFIIWAQISKKKEKQSALKVNEKITHKGQQRTFIVQKYLYRPLLYKGRKFDLRCYTLISCINNNIQGYFYKEGYLRTSCQEFNIVNITDKFIHLTNDAVQKNSLNYENLILKNLVYLRVEIKGKHQFSIKFVNYQQIQHTFPEIYQI